MVLKDITMHILTLLQSRKVLNAAIEAKFQTAGFVGTG
jgi:hypothetical protein